MNHNLSIDFQMAMSDLALAYIFNADSRWADHSINDVFDTLYGVCYEI